MRMILPALRERRAIDRLLHSFFSAYREAEFRRAIAALCRFYNLRTPKVLWFEYLDWGKSGGRTYEDGKIHLVHPENWKRGRKYNSERRWINTVYHELGHYVFWSDAERKADTFAYRMVRGIGASNGIHVVERGNAIARLASRAARRNGSLSPRPPRRRPRRSRSR
ncbi:MAG: hypothetical protein ACREQY_02870 [Candidatus Binatia bacterium]